MLVARVIARFEPGGAQLAALRLIRGLRAHGIASRLLVGEATRPGLRLLAEAEIDFEVWGRGRDDLQYACDKRFVSWLRPRLVGADLVHAHMFGAWWAASEAIAPGIPLVASEHNAIRWPATPRLAEMRDALTRVDAFLAHGPATRATFLGLGLSPARLCSARSPIEPPSPRGLADLPRPRIIFTGRLHPEKGPDVLVEALGRLRDPAPAFLLGSGRLAFALRRRICALGRKETVRLVGWQPRIGPWLCGATACVVPSRHEAWSQTAVTAMAHRVPVIASAVEGLPSTLAERRGVLVAPEDPDELASAIDAVCAGAVGVDLDGAQRYARRFTPRLVAAHYARIYRRLVARPGGEVAIAA
ncbi:MAG: glycosyltransferase [Solirubrobacterales bacterium]|nr:glycosyltransferase [Solirubrobacterales bacterium]